MDSRTAGLVVAALVLLAGCAGSASNVATTDEMTTTANTDTTIEDSETTTKVYKTTAENSKTVSTATADLPPGVNSSGVENASRLVAAHREALAESGFAFRLAANVSYEERYDAQSVARGTVAKHFAPFRIRSDVDSRMGNRTIRGTTDTWANETVLLAEYRLRNQTRYQQVDATLNETPDADPFAAMPAVNVAEQASQSAIVRFALMTGQYEVASVETRDGLTLTTLRATGVNRSLVERGYGNVSRYESTLVVDELGRVRRANTTLETNQSFVSYDFALTTVGSVVVPYPRWADRALATVNAQIDVDADSDGGYFSVVNREGELLPPGSEIRVSHAGTNTTLELTEPLRPGEEVYVYFPAGEERPVIAAEPPEEDEATPLSGEYEFQIVDPTGRTLANVGYGFGRATASEAPAGENETTAFGGETTTTAAE